MVEKPSGARAHRTKLARKLRKLKHRHDAALREIAFLRARLAEVEPHAPQPAILSGFPADYDVPQGPRTPVTHWKEAREKLLWSGLTREQALHLELTCLQRLAQTPQAAHFPRLLQVDLAAGRFELTDQGPTLKALHDSASPVVIPDFAAQIASIMAGLNAAQVVHLDMHRDGRNLCLDRAGRLSLIDFDIAAVDDIAKSGELQQRLRKFHLQGGYACLAAQMRETVASFMKLP